MNIKEQIRAEVERIEKHYLVREYDYGWNDVLDAISKFLDTLQEQPTGETSDGFHTFDELYYYRMLYNAAFFNLLPKEWVHKSKRHHTGEECFGGGWFIVVANLPTGQISNHYELKDWDLFQIPEKEFADEWDGHTPQEAAKRLHEYLRQEQPVENPKKSKFVFPKFLYARTTDNKTIDVSYAPQNMEATEYIRNDFVKPEQPVEDIKREWWNKGYLEGRKNAHIPARELGLPSSWDFQKKQLVEGLEEEFNEECHRYFNSMTPEQFLNTPNKVVARHFAEWGAEHARKEQPVEGLEEELKRYINSDEYINTRENGTLLIARHFAEWAQNTRKQ